MVQLCQKLIEIHQLEITNIILVQCGDSQLLMNTMDTFRAVDTKRGT
jgi:hypothetical protein